MQKFLRYLQLLKFFSKSCPFRCDINKFFTAKDLVSFKNTVLIIFYYVKSRFWF